MLNSKLNPKAIETRDWLLNYKQEVGYDDFKEKMAGVRNNVNLDDNSSIYLPPLDDDPLFVPLLTFDIDSSTPKASFRVELYRHDEATDTVDYSGFRFETPTQGSTKHLYYHVQPIEEMRGIIAEFPKKSPKLLGTAPCIPVHADNPISLILGLILSLYGQEGYNKITTDLHIDENLSKYIDTCMGHGEKWTQSGWNVEKP